MAKSR